MIQTTTIDLHSHYLPPGAARQADAGITVERRLDGRYDLVASGDRRALAAALCDPQLQLADLHEKGLARRVLAVPPFCFLYELPADAGARWCRALNDGIAATARAAVDTFVGFATLPLQVVTAALAELVGAARALDLQGVEIATNVNGVELDAPELEPFWAAVEAAGLPVLIHPHYVVGARRMRDYHLQNLVGNPAETALAGARLLFGGVLERHPELRVILSHGGGALAYLAGRLRHGCEVRAECKVRATAPLDGLRRLYYDTIVFDPRALRYLVETVGASQVVLGTDYPFDMAEDRPLDFVRESGLDPADADTILHNGAMILKL
jgi:aminocarboxymuconate-semialdehyde decarboxylase